MRKIIVLALAAAAGCAAFHDWTSGTIEEGIPKLREKISRSSQVYLADPVNANGYVLHARSRKDVERAFGNALGEIGVSHSFKTNGCDVSVHVVVDSWEYGDAGFSGFGDRDAVTMSVIVTDMKKDRVLTRTSLFARNLDLLVKRYVEGLFEEEEDDGK